MADITKPIAPTLTGILDRPTLHWKGASDNVGIAKYEVWDEHNGQQTYLRSLAATTRTYTPGPLAPGEHKLRVVAYDAAGNYANSNVVSVTVEGSVAAPAATPDLAPTNPSWAGPLLVDEQFAALDTTRWALYSTPGDHADEPGIRSPAAWSVVGGRLVCTATNAPDGQIVTGGMSMRLSQRGGRWEARVRTDADPTGSMSGVVLLWPSGSQRRSDGEIDFYETGTKAGTRTPVYSYVHYGASSGDFQQQITHQIDGTQWHTFAVEWEPDRAMRFYVDGLLDGTVTDPARMPIGQDHLCIQFDAFARRTLPAPLKMEVEYVKVWGPSTST